MGRFRRGRDHREEVQSFSSSGSGSAFVSMEDEEGQKKRTPERRSHRDLFHYNGGGRSTREDFHDEHSDIKKEDDESEIYIVRQEWAVLSYLFSFVQTGIMGIMMWQCGIAPVNINPMIGPYPDALSEWGGKNATLILEYGEWWRLVTPILLHAGLLHLLGNVAVQLEAGAFFEKEWGSTRWLIIYMGSAVVSSALSVIVMPQAVSVGSSGAVMGLFGGKLAEVILRCAERTDTQERRIGWHVRKEQCVTVTCSVTVVMAFSFIPYVDWAAHLGGLIGGLVVGIALFSFELEYTACKTFWLMAGTAVTSVTFYATLWYMYNGDVEKADELRDVCGYYQEQFDDYECKCQKGGEDEQQQNRYLL